MNNVNFFELANRLKYSIHAFGNCWSKIAYDLKIWRQLLYDKGMRDEYRVEINYWGRNGSRNGRGTENAFSLDPLTLKQYEVGYVARYF